MWLIRNLRSALVALFLGYNIPVALSGQQPSSTLHMERAGNLVPFTGRDSMGEVFFRGSMWLLGGFTPNRSNEVWYSADGSSWQEASRPPWIGRNLHGTISFNKRLWVMGGFGGDGQVVSLNDIYSSVDGIHWTREVERADWSPRAAFGLVEFNNELYLFGGISGTGSSDALNDVWRSDNGINWRLVSRNAQWSPRGMFGAIVFDNRLWVIAGGEYNDKYVYNIKTNYNDVWSSKDGSNWSLETESAAFSPRRFFATFVYRGRLFICCGFEADRQIFESQRFGVEKARLTADQAAFYNTERGRQYGNLNDFWCTDDGKRWSRVSLDSAFPPRHEPSVLVRDNIVFLIGGFGMELYNDVWKLSAGWGSRLVNLSLLTSFAGIGETLTLGFVVGGGNTDKAVIARGVGPSLSQFGVTDAISDPRIVLFSDGKKIAENDDWGGGIELERAFLSVGAFNYIKKESKDSAILSRVSKSDATVRVNSANDETGVALVEIYDGTSDSEFNEQSSRIINLSVLKETVSKFVAGFVIQGSSPKTVLIRAVGPTLGKSPFGILGAAADPKIELFSGQKMIDENDNWSGDVHLAGSFSRAGAFSLAPESRDAALIATLPPGVYTVQVSVKEVGIVLLEVFELP